MEGQFVFFVILGSFCFDFLESLIDVDYIPGQNKLKSHFYSKEKQTEQHWFKYVELLASRSIQSCSKNVAAGLVDSCLQKNLFDKYQQVFMYLKNSRYHFQEVTEVCKDNHMVTKITGRLCSPFIDKISETTDVFWKESQTLLNFHRNSKILPPTPINESDSKVFFIPDPCEGKKNVKVCRNMDHPCHTVMWGEWWAFHVEKHLKMNLTVLSMSLKSTASCLMIRKYSLLYLECISDSEVYVMLCGRRPQFSIVPDNFMFFVFTRHDSEKSNLLQIVFTILDSNAVKVDYLPHKIANEVYIEKLLLFDWKTEFEVKTLVFSISTEKYKKLLIFQRNISSSCLWAFDGPGYLSPKVKMVPNTLHLLSSFQSLIYLLDVQNEESPFSKFSYRTVNEIHRDIEISWGTEVAINSTYMQKYCKIAGGVHCVLKVRAPTVKLGQKKHDKTCQGNRCHISPTNIPDFYINVSLNSLLFQGYTGDKCSLAGFSLHQQVFTPGKLFLYGFSYEEDNFLFCDNYTSIEDFSHAAPVPLVSSIDFVIIVFYFFSAYVPVFSCNFKLSTTSCIGVYVATEKYQTITDLDFALAYDDFIFGQCLTIHFLPNISISSGQCAHIIINQFPVGYAVELQTYIFLEKANYFSLTNGMEQLIQCQISSNDDMITFDFPYLSNKYTLMNHAALSQDYDLTSCNMKISNYFHTSTMFIKSQPFSQIGRTFTSRLLTSDLFLCFDFF